MGRFTCECCGKEWGDSVEELRELLEVTDERIREAREYLDAAPDLRAHIVRALEEARRH